MPLEKFALLALCSLWSSRALTFQTGELHRQKGTFQSPPLVAFWSGKNANAQRAGAAPQVGPRNLSQASWVFEDPIGYGAIEASPVIDASYNSYIGTTAGGLFGIRRDGSVLWSRRLPGRVMTPMLAEGVLYVATSAAWAYAIDAATGESLWERQVGARSGSEAWSLTLAQGVVLVPAAESVDEGNDVIHALNASSGSREWSLRLRRATYNIMPAVLGDAFLFMDKTGGVFRASLRDGSVLWHAPGSKGSMATGGLALGPHGLVFATSNRRGMKQGVVHAHSVEDGSVCWRRDFDMEASSAPGVLDLDGEGPAVVVGLGNNPANGDNLLSHTSKLVALDALTGRERWAFQPPLYHGQFAKGVERGLGAHSEAMSIPDTWTNPAIGGDGTVYVGWEGGVVYALDGRTGAEVSRHDAGYSFQGEPAIAPGYLVAASIFTLIGFDGR